MRSARTEKAQHGPDHLCTSNTARASRRKARPFDSLHRRVTFGRGTLNTAGRAFTGSASTTASGSLQALCNWQSNTVNGSTTSRTHSAQNQVATVTTPAAGGGNATATLGYDADGNTLADNTGQRYVYDAWNRLVAVKAAAGTALAAYAYDAQGRRVTETHAAATTALYYSSGWQVLEERQGGTPTAQYVWSPFDVDRLVERDDHDPTTPGTALGRRMYAEQDADDNVTSLTDATGAVVERYVYDPYGAVTVQNPDGSVRGDGTAASSGYGWVYLHQGQRLDVPVGTYDFRNRVYIVNLGRFAQEDPTGYSDGANQFQIERSDPIFLTDPMGLQGGTNKGPIYRPTPPPPAPQPPPGHGGFFPGKGFLVKGQPFNGHGTPWGNWAFSGTHGDTRLPPGWTVTSVDRNGYGYATCDDPNLAQDTLNAEAIARYEDLLAEDTAYNNALAQLQNNVNSLNSDFKSLLNQNFPNIANDPAGYLMETWVRGNLSDSQTALEKIAWLLDAVSRDEIWLAYATVQPTPCDRSH